MLNNESNLWDKKYSERPEYKTREDFFHFAINNPTIKELTPYIFDGSKILEIGSGTGELISFLSFKYKVEAFGVDYSSVSIDVSNKLISKFDFKVIFKQEDITELSFEDNYFDIVFGDQVIGHIPDISKALKEIYRILKPGGYCFISAANKLRFDGWDLYKKISHNHKGYTQNSFYPWVLKNKPTSFGFNFISGYGDMVLLMRNLDLLKYKFFYKKLNNIKKTSQKEKKVYSKDVGFLKVIYYKINNIFPWWLKISIGVILKK